MTSVVLANASDAYVSEAQPSRNYSTTRQLYLADNSAANTRYAYMYFARPFPLGATILSAKLHLKSGTGFTGSVTMTVYRLTGPWSVTRVNWNNKPAATAPAVNVTKTSASTNTDWDFDLGPMMQTVANGGAWYGIRIQATGSNQKYIHSAQASEELRPTLEIEWSDAPDAPEVLRPSNGRKVSIDKPILRWDFTDVSGDTAMAAYHLRLFSSEANALGNVTTIFDSGEIASSVPEVDLSDTAYGGLAVDVTIWWRVRVKDGAGIWSGWSDPESFGRAAKGTLTIVNPAASPNNFVWEPTPPINWTFTGATQVAYQVIITTPESPAVWLWTSGKVTSADTSLTIPKNVLRDTAITYRLIIRIWDNVDREAVPDDPIYQEASRDFTFSNDATVTGVSALAGTVDVYKPWLEITWTRATQPDSWTIIRDDVVVDTAVGTELFVSGTSYKYVDRTATPRAPHVWKVLAVVNGKSSAVNPTITKTVKALTTALSELEGDRFVWLVNPNVNADMTENSEVLRVLGNAPPVLITQSLAGYEGTISGMLVNGTFPLTAEQQKTSLEHFRRTQGVRRRLTWVSMTLSVVIRNVTISPIALHDGSVEYFASFEFFQDEL